ncbi:uncharacterized protein [Panulirus ornatus]
MPEIDLDTVVEEKSEFDAEVTASDLLTTPDELIIPEEPTPPASFRAYRYMGPVQTAITTPLKTSPYRSSHAPTNLDNVTEEMDFGEDIVLDVSDDECLDAFDEDDEDDEDDDVVCDVEEEGDSVPDEDDNDEEQPGSSGSSDSDTVEACFSLSPKQVTKSPTGAHLSLKKVDGAVKRRHSSPVKVNLARNRVQRSSGKASYSHANKESPQLSRAGFDYIDRELMPEVSPRSRSHSVKLKHTGNRRAESFCMRKRRGESLKIRSKSFSRSIYHDSDGHDHRPRVHQRSAHDVSASTSQQLHNGVLECDVHNAGENGAHRSSSGDCTYGGDTSNGEETSAMTVSDVETFKDGSQTVDRSGHPGAVHASPRGGCSLTIQPDRKDAGSPLKRILHGSRTACGGDNNGASESCQVPTFGSLEKVSHCHRHERGVSPPISVSINIVNEFALMYRQEDRQMANHCNKCVEGVDKEDERSTLV